MRAEARLDEALAIFAEREAQFSAMIHRIRDNLAKMRAEMAARRETLRSSTPELK